MLIPHTIITVDKPLFLAFPSVSCTIHMKQ